MAAQQSKATDRGSVQIRQIRKEYDDVVAVKSIDLEIHPGEFLTLLGPSGCGKSTTLRMISGLETPTRGQVYISGDNVTAQAANKRTTSMVFQEWALFPHMTVEENISFGLEMDGVSKDKRQTRVTEALELVQLPGYHDRNATELSGGQKQRVAMARAVVREPDVLLLDEPLASLDRKLRQHMQVELKKIQEELGITFIYVTHDQEEALTMSDRIAVMNDGKIEQVGETSELYNHPETKFVATFLGETNLFEGTLQNIDSRPTVQTDSFDVTIEEHDTQLGESVAVTVRPEYVEIGSVDKPLAADNTWTGTVLESVYKGSIQQYIVSIDSEELQVERQLGKNATPFKEGDKVKVGFSASSCEVLGNESAHKERVDNTTTPTTD